jgi:hypothetical protein
MDSVNDIVLGTVLASRDMQISLALYAVVLLLCGWLLVRKRYLMLLLWPVLIYFCGPALSSLFAAAPTLGQYIFPELTSWETLVIFLYFMGLIAIDLIFDISSVIETSVNAHAIRQLAASPMFAVIYLVTTFAALLLQCKLLLQFGTILSGNYAYWASLDSDAASYWGFLAGLYEIVFLCVVLLLLSNYRGTAKFLYLALYAATALLRVAGGTRLVLVKELAFIVILLYLQGRIRWRQLAVAAVATVLGGTVIGLLRAGGTAWGFVGPLYGVAMESALNALTFNIAYQSYLLGAIHVTSQFAHAFMFSAVNAVPSFLRTGVSQADLDALSPYTSGLYTGFDTFSPVGGMSGFATLVYAMGNPFVGVALLVATLGMVLRWTPPNRLKEILVLVFVINAIHFWRDALDISVKLVVQDMLCALIFLYIPAVRAHLAETRLGLPESPSRPGQ